MTDREMLELCAEAMGVAPPFPPLKVPPLKEINVGDWHLIKESEGKPLIRGYFRGLQAINTNWVLRKGRETWMSVTPMELESQSHHRVAASGDVLIGGIGMGVLAYNVAQKGNVRSITVIERDESVVFLVNKIAEEFGWEHWDKVRFVIADVLNLRIPERLFDVALIDIWPSVGDMRLRPDMQRIAKLIKAREYAAWGMEMDFISWCKEQRIPPNKIHGWHWRRYSETIGVPLIMRRNRNMAKYALRAAENVVQYYNIEGQK